MNFFNCQLLFIICRSIYLLHVDFCLVSLKWKETIVLIPPNIFYLLEDWILKYRINVESVLTSFSFIINFIIKISFILWKLEFLCWKILLYHVSTQNQDERRMQGNFQLLLIIASFIFFRFRFDFKVLMWRKMRNNCYHNAFAGGIQ